MSHSVCELKILIKLYLYRCESYLSSLSASVAKEVKEKVDNFLSSYLILPDYLADAAAKLRGQVDWAIQVGSAHFDFQF